MPMKSTLTLECPVRGTIKTFRKNKNGLTPTEEYYRVEALKYLAKLGYPVANMVLEPIIKKFGHAGRNSFRSDFAVLDVPRSSINTRNVDDLLAHAILIGEVKKDNTNVDYVKNTQVKPMLDFAKHDACLGLYWDNIEQRVFWQEINEGKREIKETPLSFLPQMNDAIKIRPLTFQDTKPVDSLINAFDRIESILHQASFDLEKRYEIILQLLLTKLFDEHACEERLNTPLGVQDFSMLGLSPDHVKEKIEKLLRKAVSYYEKYLPKKVSIKLPITAETLIELLKILAPIRIIHSKRDVVQTFYMKFAKDLYRWDLAQYFTPTTVTDFIVKILNPRFGDHICDPACGSADFLVAAFHLVRPHNRSYADCVWGVDNSANAVQIAVLNMVLNGDGKTNIKKDDSLLHVNVSENRYDIMVCNPPFGSKIIEKRANVLSQFQLGYEWECNPQGEWTQTDKLLASQETGMLFAEVCVKQCKKGGRIGIILPNGYLGNRSKKYRIFREWLLKYTRLVNMTAFPRFTFKTSGADVSASVLFLEKRCQPLEKLLDDEYPFSVEMIEKVGWDAGNKKAAPIYKRNSDDGSLLVEDGNLILDADFADAVKNIRASKVGESYNWLTEGQQIETVKKAWSLPVSTILKDPDLTMDPKRYCRKISVLRNDLKKNKYLPLGDIVDFIPERTSANSENVKIIPSEKYGYIELQNIGYGDFHYEPLAGWQLPSRARHFAEIDDVYFGSIWGSVAKWCYIGKGFSDLVVTNGCHRCRLKTGKEKHRIDLIAYMNTEGWAAQLRAFARGSDGLAEITQEDAKKVIIPMIKEQTVRESIAPFVENLKSGRITLKSTISSLLSNNTWNIDEPERRSSHIVLV